MTNFIINQKLHLHFSTLGPWLQSPSLTHCPPEAPSGPSGLATAEEMMEKKILLQMTKEQSPTSGELYYLTYIITQILICQRRRKIFATAWSGDLKNVRLDMLKTFGVCSL